MAQEISFEEAMGTPPVGVKPKAISFEDVAGNAAPEPEAAPPADTFLGRTKTAVVDVGRAVATHPGKAAVGGVKAVTAGVVSLGDLAMQGVTGLAVAAMDRWNQGKVINTDQMRGAFGAGADAGHEKIEAVKNYMSRITGVNLAPKNKEEEAMQAFLEILPDAVTAGGDTVYEKTGNALAGAGTQALLTLLMIRPGIAGKIFRGGAKVAEAADQVKYRPSKKVESVFDELAVKDSPAAEALAEHVGKTDPELGDLMLERAKEKAGASAEEQAEIGAVSARAKLHEEPMDKPEDLDAFVAEYGTPVENMLDAERALSDGERVFALHEQSDTVHEVVNVTDLKGYTYDQLNVVSRFAKERKEVNAGAAGAAQALNVPGVTAGKLKAQASATAAKPDVRAALHDLLNKAMTRDAMEAQGRDILESMDGAGETPRAVSEEFWKSTFPKLNESNQKRFIKYAKSLTGWEPGATIATMRDAKNKVTAIKARDWQHIGEEIGKDFPKEAESLEGTERGYVAMMKWANTKAGELSKYKTVGEEASGKPRLRLLTSDEASSYIREAVRDGHETLNRKEPPGGPHSEDPVIYMSGGSPITFGHIAKAFRVGERLMKEIPGAPILESKLREYYKQALTTFHPEGLGKEAEVAASTVAKAISQQMQKDSSYFHRAAGRRNFWSQRMPEARMFIDGFEKGQKFADPLLNKASEGYREWNREIFENDRRLGFTYETQENYLYHMFEKGDEVASFLERKFGPKWGDPGFIKERSFEMYSQAVAAGYKPKFTNPEDIMLARQHASDAAQMKVQVLRDLETYGLAKRITKESKERPEDFPSSEWRSPTGERYWVHANADKVLHNAFETKSLWTMKGIGGDAFRGMMALKNTLVPIKLALSLFHPLHVATIDNATGMVRASKELLAGTSNPARWMGQMGSAALYKGAISDTRGGYRMLKAFQGKIKESDLTGADRQSLQYIAEGGMIPEMSIQYRTNAVKNLRDAISRRSAAALFHAPLAAISLMQKPMFEIWIPSLKIASYLKDVKTAVRADPSLLESPLRRQLAFRRLSKSVDNRYGEMAYNTLFWNRWVKDLAVANTLSLGWQLGFLREYGGGAMDIGQAIKGPGGVAAKAKAGMLDRPLFVTFYTTQALAYGGLLTWALTGKSPASLMDYIYPQSGEKNPDGSAQRLNTMFYPREFASIYKHMQHEGVVEGLTQAVENKASGLIGLIKEWATGVNSFGQEIRDPDAPAYKKLEQTLVSTLADLEPISIEAIQKQVSEHPVKTGALSVAGFSPAPKYVTESATEAAIKGTYLKYYASKQTPYEKAEYSGERHQLQKLYNADDPKYEDLLETVVDKYELTGKEQRRLERGIAKDEDPNVKMFQRMTWKQQKKILDGMTEDEREVYLPHANKEHLRYSYEAPE